VDNNLKIAFLSAKDKEFFGSSKQVAKAHGSENAKKLSRRLDDLDAAQSMDDMRGLPGHWEELKNDRTGQFSVRLHGGLRLIVKPQKLPPPAKPDGGLDWPAIDSIYIVEMVDYHD
jgi:proteic killer suppression protein